MEFLIALAVVFVGICAWINYYGDEVPPDDEEEDYISHSSRYSYEEDDDSDDDSDSDGDSDGGDGGD